MYNLVYKDQTIAFTELEYGDPPMGVAHGVLLPAEDITLFDFFSSLSNFETELNCEIDEENGFLHLELNDELTVSSKEGVQITGIGISVDGIDDEFQIAILGIESELYLQEFPQHWDSYYTLFEHK